MWDVRSTRSCLHRFVDDGCIHGTSIAVSPNNQYLATGSDSGVVNLYERHEVMKRANPKPTKIILNLTTTIGQLKFNPTAEVLAMSSELKENAIKMLHVPTRTVFSNFPPLNFNLKRVSCLDFSHHSGFLGVGNKCGAANLFRLSHEISLSLSGVTCLPFPMPFTFRLKHFSTS